MHKIITIVVFWLLCASTQGLGALEAQAFDGQININSAGGKELEALPFIGESRAQAIVRYRQKKGPFSSVDELRQVPEIGEDTFKAIKPYLTLSGGTTFSQGKPPALRPTALGQSLAPIVTRVGEVRLLTDQEYYPTLQRLLGHARQRIDMTMFVFKTTSSAKNRARGLVQDLIAARKRGVAIDLLLERSSYDPKLTKENQKVAAILKKQGITVRFDSEKTTTHAKIVIIDQRYCLVGSHNFTSSALSYNHEASLLVDNQELASQLLTYMRGIR